MSIFNKTICRISINVLQIAKYSTTAPGSTGVFMFKSNFTIKEQEKVLNILNGSNSEQLASFSVPQSRIKNLEIWKTKRGPFRSLNDVLEVDGLSEKVLEKICENIISDNVNTKVNIKNKNVINKRLKQLVSPPLPTHTFNGIQSVVGIHLGPMGVSWAKLSRHQNELSDWSSEGFSELPKKMLTSDTFDLAVRILHRLPPGDIYILEATPSVSLQASNQVSTIASYTQQLELNSMLIALLNTSVHHNKLLHETDCNNSTIIKNVVYHLRARIPARLFRTLVGRERVSALTTVVELVKNDGRTKSFPLPCTPIMLTDELRNVFFAKNSSNKELLGQALMLVVSFMDVCVYKNPISLVAISPEKNNKQ